MEQPTPHKRKPGRPRKAKPNAGAQNTQTPSNPSEANPLEATIKAARKAYDPQAGIQSFQASKASEALKETQGQANSSQAKDSPTREASKQGAGEAMRTGTGMATGAAISHPFPLPRTRGNLMNASAYVNSLAPELIEGWATAFIATGKREKWIIDVCPAIGRENNRWRADLIHELERSEVALATIARLKEEAVMSDLQRRKLLKEIAHAPEHGLRGFADNLKAIELDSKADPESVENKRKAEAANSLTFNAPVSLFFMPSTQARAIPQQAEAIEVATLPTPPVGGTPGT